jgi:DNA polymerase-3 subunit epsilon
VILACFDLETTGTDPATAEVVQAACVLGDESHKALFRSDYPIPAEATAVHGITDAMVAESPRFADCAESLAEGLRSADVLLTFNGLSYDVPILERYLGRPLGHPCHVDVYRLWRRFQARGARNAGEGADSVPADLLRGSLGAAYYWSTGTVLDGAHDALNDVQGTLIAAGFMRYNSPDPDWAELARLSQSPLPGFADLDGKLRWSGRDLLFTFGKHAGVSLRKICDCDSRYLSWITSSDFPDDVKQIVRAARRGMHPNPPASENP